MRLALTRLDEQRYDTVITRGDGVRFHVKGVGHVFAIPHDLAHLVIERALGLRRGFWGCVAAGVVFESMAWLDGRRRPHAVERSRALLRDHSAELGEAECLVRIFNDALQQGAGAAEIATTLRTRWAPGGQAPRPIPDADVAAACAAWKEMRELWNALPVGATLELDWADEPAGRSRAHRGRHGDRDRPRYWRGW